MSAEQQIKVLADYIMGNIPGEPSRDEGAGTCAVRLLTEYRSAFDRIMHELGVPGPDYLTPVANAYEIAAEMLASYFHQVVPYAVGDEVVGREE